MARIRRKSWGFFRLKKTNVADSNAATELPSDQPKEKFKNNFVLPAMEAHCHFLR